MFATVVTTANTSDMYGFVGEPTTQEYILYSAAVILSIFAVFIIQAVVFYLLEEDWEATLDVPESRCGNTTPEVEVEALRQHDRTHEFDYARKAERARLKEEARERHFAQVERDRERKLRRRERNIRRINNQLAARS